MGAGEVEGQNKLRGSDRLLRSDKFFYTEDGDVAVAEFTRRLDLLVLKFTEQVPGLRKVNLMRGAPMAAVYQGAGARYTPHFGAIGGDNGRVLTCLVYLNPFWRKGDGAELQLWPEAKYIKPEGECHVVEPLHGRLVAFLCDGRNLHAVSPVADDRDLEPRMAISCWYYDADAVPRVAAEQR